MGMDNMIDTSMLGTLFYLGAIGLILLGIFCAIAMHNLVRILLGLTLLEAGVNLFLVAVGFRPDAAAPIILGERLPAMVDPVPQALILTAIVIGVGVLALALALTVRIYEREGTLDNFVLAQRLSGEHEQEIPIRHIPVRSASPLARGGGDG